MELETEPPVAEALGTEIVPDVTHESGVTHESVAIAQSGIEKRPTLDLSLDGEDESAASHWAAATLQLTQDERFVRAGQADPEALQDLFRQELAAYGVTQVDVELRGVGLQVSLSGREVPDQEILEPLVKECTVQLGLTKIQTIELYGQKEGSDLPFWRSIFKPAELERTAPRQKPPEVKPVTFIFSGTSSQSTANVHEAVLKDADVLPEPIATQSLSSLPEHGPLNSNALNSGNSDSGDSDSGDSDSGALGYVDHERQEESDSGFSTVSLDPVSLDVNSAPIASLETPLIDPAPSGLGSNEGSNELSRDAQAGASSDVLISLDSPVPDSESVSQVSPDISPELKPVVENLETTAKRKAVEAFLARYAAGERSFIKIDLSDSDLSGVSLTLADLQEAHLVWSNLEGASLYHVNLLGAKLRQANLKGATLRNANLRGTDFLNADLSGADLSWSNLTGANLTGANLTDANLKNAVLDNVIMPDGTRLD